MTKLSVIPSKARNLLFIFITTFILWQPAEAIVELRAGYGINQVGDYTTGGNNFEIAGFAGFNVDAILELPMLPFGFGLRYESMGFDLEAGGQTGDVDFTRTSILINYRLIDLFAYVGLIGSIGMSNEMDFKTGGLIVSGTKYEADLTYSVGVEAGVSLGLFMVGGELGYFMGSYEDQGASPASDFDADGVYAKVIVGVGL